MNHANFYVQNGTGVNSIQYTAAAFGNNRKVNLGSEKTLEAKAQRKAA
jgi:hypothetical protein